MSHASKRIRSLRTTQAQVEILHSLTPSAGIRITKDGRKTFFMIYRVPGTGQQKRHSFGFHPSGRKGRGRAEEPLTPMTLQELERAYDLFRGELAKGRDPKEGSQGEGLAPKRIAAESLPQDLRTLFPDGVTEGTIGASEAASARAENLILINGERVWSIPDTKNGRDFLIPLVGPIAKILLRRSMQVGGTGPLFWKYNADRDDPDQLKSANRNSGSFLSLRTCARMTGGGPEGLTSVRLAYARRSRKPPLCAAQVHLQDFHRQKDPILLRLDEKKRLRALVDAAWHALDFLPPPSPCPVRGSIRDPKGDLRKALDDLHDCLDEVQEEYQKG